MARRREASVALGAALGALASTAAPAQPAPQAAGSLRFAVSQSWGPPFVERVGNRLVGGIFPDLMTQIAAEAGLSPEFKLLPAARVDEALRDGEVDLHCLLSPSWAPSLRGSPRWSVPLLTLRDVLVGLPDGPARLDALPAGRATLIGTVRGYRYPALQGLFEAGTLRREDAPDQWSVLEKLQRGRSELAVVNDYALLAYRRRNPGTRVRRLAVLEEVQGHCLLSERPALPPARLQASIQRALSKGRVSEALEPYLRDPTR